MPDEATLTINGSQITVPKDTLVIEAAKQLGIEIPVFCYHEKLEPVGACRQCLVEIEGFPKPQVSCSTKVADGMVVRTDTPQVKDMWKSVVEFLLINHPLDCPVCDRGGECPLQDNTFKYGPDDSRFEQEKRHFEKPVQLSPLVVMDRERCIQCFRCVRFQKEIAGHPQIQMMDRGYGDYIGTFPGQPFDSNFSGNTIEICPVGALLSSVFRFRARPWEMKPTQSICPNCGVGCNIRIDARNDRWVVRYLSRENKDVDDGWLCDRGRFDSTFINSPERLTKPLVRKNGELQEASWDEALKTALDGMMLAEAGLHAGGLGSAKCTNEQNYLFGKFMRTVIGTNSVDFSVKPRARGGMDALISAMSDGFFDGSIRDIVQSEVILSIGSDISDQLPLIDLWIKKAVTKKNRKLIFAYPLRAELADYASVYVQYSEHQEVEFVEALRESLSGEHNLKHHNLDYESINTASQLLMTSAGPIELLISRNLVEFAQHGAKFLDVLRQIGQILTAKGVEVRVMLLSDETNSQGALDAGLLPDYYAGHRKATDDALHEMSRIWGSELPAESGLSGREMINSAASRRLKALWVMGQDPASDLIYGDEVQKAIQNLEMLIVQDHFLTQTAKMAHVVLPSCTFAENRGTFTNTERRIQQINPAIRRIRDSLPDTEIIIRAAHLAGAKGFDFKRIEDIFEEITNVVPAYAGITWDSIGPKGRQWEVRK